MGAAAPVETGVSGLARRGLAALTMALAGFGVQASGFGGLTPEARSLTPEASYLLIVVGLAGDPEHGELFQKWGMSLAETAAQRLGVPKEHVTLLSGDRATRGEVTKALSALTAAGEDETVMIVLFGHGTYANKVAKFNLKGPDMTPEDFDAVLKKLRSKRIVFVDTASGSGPFVEALSGPGRVIVTATRTGAEQFATLFGGYFVDALSAEAADADKNRRVTVLEAFEHAKREVARAYEREGLLATEHALLDDGAKAAATVSLGSGDAAGPESTDPKLRALIEERREMERRIESLKLLKSSMDQQRYLSELEKLATALARKTREIKELEGKS
jgi:hypothetical protein